MANCGDSRAILGMYVCIYIYNIYNIIYIYIYNGQLRRLPRDLRCVCMYI